MPQSRRAIAGAGGTAIGSEADFANDRRQPLWDGAAARRLQRRAGLALRLELPGRVTGRDVRLPRTVEAVLRGMTERPIWGKRREGRRIELLEERDGSAAHRCR